MADNTDVTEVGEESFQPKQEIETYDSNPEIDPVTTIDPANSLPLTPTSPPPIQPLTPNFTGPASPSQTTPLLVVTGERESNSANAESDTVSGSSKGNGADSGNVETGDDEHDQANHLESQSNGERSRQDSGSTQESGSTEGSRRDGPPTRSRSQPVLDASKLKERESKNTHFRQQQLTERQKRIDTLRSKEDTHRAEILERKKRQEEVEQARKEAIVRRSRERSENAHEKRRSWSAFGSRDISSPVPSNSRPRTPRGRSTDRMTERQSLGGVLPLGTSKRLSSSVSALHRPVHLVRLGPNEDDWFEVHIPEPLNRRASASGNDKSLDSTSSPPKPASSSATPRHHLSSPNLASTYSTRDSRSAHSTPTHVSRPLSAAKRSNSNSRIDDDGSSTPTPSSAPPKRAPSPRTPLHLRPPSPRQQASQARVPSPRTIGSHGSTTVDGSRPKQARAPSPRSMPKQTNGDVSRKPREVKKTPSQAPPIKKALTPRTDIAKSTVGSPTKTPTTPKSAPKPSATKLATTPKGVPKQAKPAAVKAAPSAPKAAAPKAAAPKAAAPSAPVAAAAAPAPSKQTEEEAVVKPEESKESIQKEPERAGSPSISESSSTSAPSSNGSAPAAQPAPASNGSAPAAQPAPAAPAAQSAPAAQPAPVAQPTPAPAAEQPPAPKELTDEERAKQALAERRRQAREKAEIEAEAERQRQEQLKREEEERIRLEEEERIRQEEEAIRLAEEHKKAEEERLRRTIEENEEQERLEVERKAAEEAEAVQRAEEEKLRQEELKRQEEELAEKCRKEEDERVARKKRVEEIMKRARRGAQAKDNNEPSEDGDSGSESGSGSSSERKTNGVNSILASSSLLNNEKYRNLLFNRNKTELSAEDENDYDNDQMLEGAVNSSSDSEDRELSEEAVEAADFDPQDQPEQSEDKGIELADNGDIEHEVSDEDRVPDEIPEQPDWSDVIKGAEPEESLESPKEDSEDQKFDNGAITDMDMTENGGVAEKALDVNQATDIKEADPQMESTHFCDDVIEVGGATEEDIKMDSSLAPPTNGNGNVDDRDDMSSDDEKSGLSSNGCEAPPLDPASSPDPAPLLDSFTPPNNNVPASEDFNNANGESGFIESGTELITKKSLLDLDDVAGTPDDGDLTPDSASDKLNANLGMKPMFPSDDASMMLSFAPLDVMESNGDQQPPMAVCLTPEDAV